MWLGTASCMAEVFTLMLLSGSHAELLLLPCWLVGTATHGPEMQLKARVSCWSVCFFQRSARFGGALSSLTGTMAQCLAGGCPTCMTR